MRKPVFGISDQVPHKLAVQSQKMARGLKFCIKEVEELYYLWSKNIGADQLTAKLICIFVFAYAKSRFSHNKAHFICIQFCQKGCKFGKVDGRQHLFVFVISAFVFTT